MIPEMTDPLGKYWHQPKDIREAPMDDAHVILTKKQYNSLASYDTTNPSGVYPGKCWKRTNRHGKFLVWYGECDDPTQCSINARTILIV